MQVSRKFSPAVFAKASVITNGSMRALTGPRGTPPVTDAVILAKTVEPYFIFLPPRPLFAFATLFF